MIHGVMKSLAEVAEEQPYPDYQAWWPLGAAFLSMMQQAVKTTWREVCSENEIENVVRYTTEYFKLVYHKAPRENLNVDFHAQNFISRFFSGEFDALSYAYFRSAFEAIGNDTSGRRKFTQVVGRRFFNAMKAHLSLDMPAGLNSASDFERLKFAIDNLGAFLVEEGYLRDSFAFTFNVLIHHQGKKIEQNETQVPGLLEAGNTAYALYRMGYPVILPSAVYLYHTVGEAQHHSSRTIEELFKQVNCKASETADFDPAGYPADEVVELWEIDKLIQENR